jgi:hypothetical protein
LDSFAFGLLANDEQKETVRQTTEKLLQEKFPNYKLRLGKLREEDEPDP